MNVFNCGSSTISSGICEILVPDISNVLKLFSPENVLGKKLYIFGKFVIFNSTKFEKLFIFSGNSSV